MHSRHSLLLHMTQNSQVIPVLGDFPLNLVKEISELHENHQGGHAEEDVAPEQHVHVMKEIHGKDGQFRDELHVICEWSAFVP